MKRARPRCNVYGCVLEEFHDGHHDNSGQWPSRCLWMGVGMLILTAGRALVIATVGR